MVDLKDLRDRLRRAKVTTNEVAALFDEPRGTSSCRTAGTIDISPAQVRLLEFAIKARERQIEGAGVE